MTEILSLPGLIVAVLLAGWWVVKRYLTGLKEQARLEAESQQRKERLKVIANSVLKVEKEKQAYVDQVNEFLGSSNNGNNGDGSDGGSAS